MTDWPDDRHPIPSILQSFDDGPAFVDYVRKLEAVVEAARPPDLVVHNVEPHDVVEMRTVQGIIDWTLRVRKALAAMDTLNNP